MNSQLLSALIGALVGGVITILGWFASYHFSQKSDKKNRQREAAIQHLEQQIEELYAPLWGLILQSEVIYAVLRDILPATQDGAIDYSRVGEEDAEILNYFKDNFLRSLNVRISDLIRSKVHLLESGDIPDSFKDYLSYHAQSETLHRLWKDKGISNLGVVPSRRWPTQFNVDVAETLERLRGRYQELLRQAGNI